MTRGAERGKSHLNKKIGMNTRKFVELVIRELIQRVLGRKDGAVNGGEEVRVLLTNDRKQMLEFIMWIWTVCRL